MANSKKPADPPQNSKPFSWVDSLKQGLINSGFVALLGVFAWSTLVGQRLAKSEMQLEQLGKTLDQAESRLTKSIDEVKSNVRDVDKEVSQLDSRVSGLKGEVDILTKLAGQASTTSVRAWLVAVTPDVNSDKPVLGVYLIDALDGTIKSWDPIPVNVKDDQSKAVAMGRFWAVARGADSASELLDVVMPETNKAALMQILWTGCSFGMTISSDEIPATVTQVFFLGEPKTKQGLGSRPVTIENLAEFVQGNKLLNW